MKTTKKDKSWHELMTACEAVAWELGTNGVETGSKQFDNLIQHMRTRFIWGTEGKDVEGMWVARERHEALFHAVKKATGKRAIIEEFYDHEACCYRLSVTMPGKYKYRKAVKLLCDVLIEHDAVLNMGDGGL